MGPVVAFITSLTGMITAIATLVVSLRVLRSSKDVHTLVNQSHTDNMKYNQDLRQALTDGGITVPDDQSLTNGKA